MPGGRPLFTDLDLQVRSGESLVLLGPSGVGKSTLLRLLAGLEEPAGGELRVGSGSIGGGGHSYAVVFQKPLLYPWLTVRENVALGGRFRALRGRVDARHVDDLLDHFGIAELADSRPDQISGGQAQRVAVVRAAATRPEILLLDEPFSALDPVTRADSQRWLVGVTADLGVTSVMVTHDVDEALVVGSRIALLGSSGRVQQEWTNPSHGTTDSDPALRESILAAYRTA
ncbi:MULTISPECIES: ABC transporter ATP-binding protein [Dietzia]|uniref:ABC transporter ATP-binding protein n=1 Tax=Dietzia TaxID=37914 RepID=UPI0006808B51|nr:ABC transporter [Dietzia maris]MBM7230325.1 ATP-binding cassette domain-containing protein [Dietzia cinnamea]